MDLPQNEAAPSTEHNHGHIVALLLDALGARDEDTRTHSVRVSRLAVSLAKALGHDASMCRIAEQAALLHDLGKIGVPDGELTKPGSLSDAEWVSMRSHPEIGAEMLSSIPPLAEVARGIRHHHEHWDGTGYPDGLSGDEIPEAACIVALCEVYDSLTHDQPWREAWSQEKATEHIANLRGKAFAPAVADAFLREMTGCDSG